MAPIWRVIPAFEETPSYPSCPHNAFVLPSPAPFSIVSCPTVVAPLVANNVFGSSGVAPLKVTSKSNPADLRISSKSSAVYSLPAAR